MSNAQKIGRGNGTWNDWTTGRIEILRDLWADGLSCSKIAAVLGDGFTRSAVIGKVRRLNLARRVEGGEFVVVERPPPIPRVAKPKPEPVAPARFPQSLHVPLLDAHPRQCRFIAGDPSAEATVCGHPVHLRSYCEFHWRLTHDLAATERGARKAAMAEKAAA